MLLHPKLLAAAALVVTACATTPPGRLLAMRSPEIPAGPPGSFTRQGEIQYTPIGTAGSSAAWDARSVRGPAVNLTLTEEGLWGGTIQDRVVLLHARNGRITGEGVNVWVTQDGPVLHVQGLWFNRFVGMEFSPDTISASPLTGVCAVELSRAPDGLWRGFGGCGGALDYIWMSLKGVAADPAAEMPQWFFAFLGALPAPQVSVFRPAAAAVVAGPGSLGYFLNAEYPGPALGGEPPLPCSYWDQRLCGPFGYPLTNQVALRRSDWYRQGGEIQPVAQRPGRDDMSGSRGRPGRDPSIGGRGGSGTGHAGGRGETVATPRSGGGARSDGHAAAGPRPDGGRSDGGRYDGGRPADRGGSAGDARAARTSGP